MKLAAAVAVFMVVLGARPAVACTCFQESGDVMQLLRSARERAGAIFYARVLTVEGAEAPYTTTLEVLETFKGEVSGRVKMPSGDNGGDCSFKFNKGGRYLVYANASPALRTGHCTRSRRLENTEDAELKWLRTGTPVPTPVAIQREEVACNRCRLEVFAEQLAGPNVERDGVTRFGLDDEDAAREFAARRPSWAGGRYNHEDPSWTDMVGLTKAGRAFRLVRAPADADATCQQRITLTFCESLKPAKRGWGLPQFECVKPAEATVVCDENTTRRTTSLPVESMRSVKGCDWREVDKPRCKLDANTHAADAGRPLLLCTPESESNPDGRPPIWFVCRVAPDAPLPRESRTRD